MFADLAAIYAGNNHVPESLFDFWNICFQPLLNETRYVNT